MNKTLRKKINNYYQWEVRWNIIATLITILAVEVIVFLHQTGIVVMVAHHS